MSDAVQPLYESCELWAPFTIVPLWNSRGAPDYGYFAETGRQLTFPGDTARKVLVDWPMQREAYGITGVVRFSWHGTLTEDKQDKTLTNYRRNRYYDPATGRFTQEDPIGFAGGLNLYGFASGDPVNFSDPYGLNPCRMPNFDAAACARQAALAMLEGAVQGLGVVVDALGVRGLGEAATGVDSRSGERLQVGQRIRAVGIDIALAAPVGRVGRLGVHGRALLGARPVRAALAADVDHRAASFVRDQAARSGSHFRIVRQRRRAIYVDAAAGRTERRCRPLRVHSRPWG